MTRARLTLAAALLAAAPALAQGGNLLKTARLVRADNTENPARITDGTAPAEGDNWQSDFTAILKPNGVVEWDLGQVVTIGAARLQGDNNDLYIVQVSEDGQQWTPLWRAMDVEGAGMRTRDIAPIEARARYVRLTAEAGDQMYSVGELELFAQAAELTQPANAPKRMGATPPPPPPACNTTWLVVVGFAAAVWFFLRRKVAAPEGAAAPAEEKKDASAEPPKDEKKDS